MPQWVLPTFHPAHIMRRNRRLEGLLQKDLKRAIGLANGTWKPNWNEKGVGYIMRPTADDVVRILDSMHGTDVAYDIETDGQHPLLCDIRCIGFWNGKVGVCVPWLFRDGTTQEVTVLDKKGEPAKDKKGRIKTKTVPVWKKYFSGQALERVNAAVQGLFSRARSLITQNGQYDRLCLKVRMGFTIPWGPPHFDTILAHHLVASYLNHGLDLLTSVYTDMPYYKKTEEGEAWSTSSDRELWLYNLRDCEATWLSAQKLRKEVRERPEDEALYEHDAWQEYQAQLWKEAGIECDEEALLLFRQHYAAIAAKALAAMKEVVERSLKVAGSLGVTEAEENLIELLERLKGKADEEEFDDLGKLVEKFNPASLIQLRALLVGIGIPLSAETDTGQLSTAEEFLLTARKELLAQGVDPKDDRLAFLDYLFAWRSSTKVKSTYLYPELIEHEYIGVNGGKAKRLHPTFSVHVVPSGRLCIAGWTPVLFRRGIVQGREQLQNLRVGDLVWTHRNRWRRITAVHRQGVKQAFDIRLSNGYVLTATNDHRFLGEDGQWVTVRELHERLQSMGSGEGQSRSGSLGVSRPRLANARNGRCSLEDDLPKRTGGSSAGDVSRGLAHLGQAPLLGLQDGQQESHDGEDREEAPSVEGSLRGPEGLPHDSLEGQEALRASRRSSEEVGAEVTASARSGRPPYRRRQDEQRLGEPRSGFSDGPPRDSLSAIKGRLGVEVEEINARGGVETFDLTVEDDESFDAAGVFSHNSSQKPNFQNQPATIRGMFVARPGHILVYIDWDALEMRLGAFMSGDRTFIEDFKKWDARTGPKVHIVNMCAIFGLKLEPGVEDKHPGCYRAAKVFAYAVAYGAGEQTVFEQVRAEMPDMKFDEFKKVFEQYKLFRKRLFEFQKEVVKHATQRQCYDTAITGRRAYFFEQVFGEDSPEASAMQNFPYQGTGADVVGRANRRIWERVLLPMQKGLAKGEVLQQLAQVHDELLFEVPIRLADEFCKRLKPVAEEPPGKAYTSWSLPVDLKKTRRWKPIKWSCAHCDKALKNKVELELTTCTPVLSTWTGTCEKCKKTTSVEVLKTPAVTNPEEPTRAHQEEEPAEEVVVQEVSPTKRKARAPAKRTRRASV